MKNREYDYLKSLRTNVRCKKNYVQATYTRSYDPVIIYEIPAMVNILNYIYTCTAVRLTR